MLKKRPRWGGLKSAFGARLEEDRIKQIRSPQDRTAPARSQLSHSPERSSQGSSRPFCLQWRTTQAPGTGSTDLASTRRTLLPIALSAESVTGAQHSPLRSQSTCTQQHRFRQPQTVTSSYVPRRNKLRRYQGPQGRRSTASQRFVLRTQSKRPINPALRVL